MHHQLFGTGGESGVQCQRFVVQKYQKTHHRARQIKQWKIMVCQKAAIPAPLFKGGFTFNCISSLK